MKQILELWRRARMHGEDVFLATVAHVQGSSYRKPGARMLVTSGGERAGTISGGCLEAEVSRKIAWLTKDGPALQSYQTSFEDEPDRASVALGCDGKIWVLMEAGERVDAVMHAIVKALDQRKSSVAITSLAPGESFSTVLLSDGQILEPCKKTVCGRQEEHARQALTERRSVASPILVDELLPEYVCMPILPPPKLHIFGAGDDAQPIVRFGIELGWDVTVADGRHHLLRQERFPEAHLNFLTYSKPDSGEQVARELVGGPGVNEGDHAVILTHSYEQDRALLKILLPEPLRYLGILGPLHRTKRILGLVSKEIGLDPEDCLARLHAPVGLDIGSGDPAIIALSIVAEIQAQIAEVRVRVEAHRRVDAQRDIEGEMPAAQATAEARCSIQ